jgi:hypothetical protein
MLKHKSQIDLKFLFSPNGEIDLGDMKSSGIHLTDGKLAGMTNLARWGEAKMETM